MDLSKTRLRAILQSWMTRKKVKSIKSKLLQQGNSINDDEYKTQFHRLFNITTIDKLADLMKQSEQFDQVPSALQGQVKEEMMQNFNVSTLTHRDSWNRSSNSFSKIFPNTELHEHRFTYLLSDLLDVLSQSSLASLEVPHLMKLR